MVSETITERQKSILDKLIHQYIVLAEPVSSQLLKKEYGFALCPASIRQEMQKLTEQGYLYQPHTSAGRVPTNKAYRLFVNNLLKEEFTLTLFDQNFLKKLQKAVREVENMLHFFQLLTKSLSSFSLNLSLGYLPQQDILFKEGWEGVFQEPEFKDFNFRVRFLRAVRILENKIRTAKTCPVRNKVSNGVKEKGLLKVYVGEENPFLKSDDISMLVSRYFFFKDEEGILMLVGPKRMSYQKNIVLMNSVIKLLKSL